MAAPAGIAFLIGRPATACQDKGNHKEGLFLVLSDLRAASRRLELVLANPELRKKWRDQIAQKDAIAFALRATRLATRRLILGPWRSRVFSPVVRMVSRVCVASS